MPALGWIIPVGSLLIFNKMAIGSWTGYDTTNESGFAQGSFWHNYWHAHANEAAFTWEKFVQTWEQVVRTFNDSGMFFTFALAVLGIGLIFKRSWRYGLLIVLWLVPGIGLYASYYWSPDRGVSYARFFVTFFPAILLGAAVCIRHGIIGSDDEGYPRRSIAAPIAAGILVAAAAGIGLYRAQYGMEDGQRVANQSLVGMQRQYASLAVSGDMLAKNVLPQSIVFADGPRMAEGMMNYGQFMGDWEMYPFTAFTGSVQRAFFSRKDPDPTDPNPLQPRRREAMSAFYNSKSEGDLAAAQKEIVQTALTAGRHVYLVGTPASVLTYEDKFFPKDKFTATVVARWKDQIEPTLGSGEEPPKAPEQRGPGRMNGGGGGGRGQGGGGRGMGGPGGPPAGARGGFNEWTFSSWQLVEMKLRDVAPATQPAQK